MVGLAGGTNEAVFKAKDDGAATTREDTHNASSNTHNKRLFMVGECPFVGMLDGILHHINDEGLVFDDLQASKRCATWKIFRCAYVRV